jgi:hypothetical protein
MIEFLNEVADYLESLTEANRKLLVALKDYQELLVTGEPRAIEQATPRLDRLTGDIRCLDERRRAYVDDFFNVRGWNGVRNFSAIAERVMASEVNDEEAAAFERLKDARTNLIAVLAEVDAQNSLNITLIGQGMSFAEVSLRALLGLEDNPTTYGPSDGGEDGPSLLDARA